MPIEPLRLTRDMLEKQFFTPQFRDLFPDMAEKFSEYFKNPSCPCNYGLVQHVVSDGTALERWFKRPVMLDDNLRAMSEKLMMRHGPGGQREFWVLNTTTDKLQSELDSLPPGPKTFAIARWQDQVTVVIQDLEQETALTVPDQNA